MNLIIFLSGLILGGSLGVILMGIIIGGKNEWRNRTSNRICINE
jgi:hypothetical protein